METAAIQPFLHPICCFAGHTGARRSEMLRVKLADLDLDGGTLRIPDKCSPGMASHPSWWAVPVQPAGHRHQEQEETDDGHSDHELSASDAVRQRPRLDVLLELHQGQILQRKDCEKVSGPTVSHC